MDNVYAKNTVSSPLSRNPRSLDNNLPGCRGSTLRYDNNARQAQAPAHDEVSSSSSDDESEEERIRLSTVLDEYWDVQKPSLSIDTIAIPQYALALAQRASSRPVAAQDVYSDDDAPLRSTPLVNRAAAAQAAAMQASTEKSGKMKKGKKSKKNGPATPLQFDYVEPADDTPVEGTLLSQQRYNSELNTHKKVVTLPLNPPSPVSAAALDSDNMPLSMARHSMLIPSNLPPGMNMMDHNTMMMNAMSIGMRMAMMMQNQGMMPENAFYQQASRTSRHETAHRSRSRQPKEDSDSFESQSESETRHRSRSRSSRQARRSSRSHKHRGDSDEEASTDSEKDRQKSKDRRSGRSKTRRSSKVADDSGAKSQSKSRSKSSGKRASKDLTAERSYKHTEDVTKPIRQETTRNSLEPLNEARPAMKTINRLAEFKANSKNPPTLMPTAAVHSPSFYASSTPSRSDVNCASLVDTPIRKEAERLNAPRSPNLKSLEGTNIVRTRVSHILESLESYASPK